MKLLCEKQHKYLQIMIVESGATKTDWYCNGHHVRTNGINPTIMSDNDIKEVVSSAIMSFAETKSEIKIEGLFFYGAGIINDTGIINGNKIRPNPISERLYSIFSEYLGTVPMQFSSDLLAAARALWADQPGIVAILGTGSNSGIYDGQKIVKNIRPGGYILGDEGGGVAVGRRFIADFIKDLVPHELKDEFEYEYQLDYQKITTEVYRGHNPSGFLASFAPFVVKHVSDSEYALEIVKDNFRNFIVRSLLAYRSNTEDIEVGVSGTLGYTCRKIIEPIGREYGVYFVKFIKTPIRKLYEYHADKSSCTNNMI